jgi:glycosyltransferase involved in cell wall biosynthesis
LALRRSGVRARLVVTYHSMLLQSAKEWLKMLYYRPFFWAADALIFVCENQQRYWLRRGVFSRRNEVIHNGVDTDEFCGWIGEMGQPRDPDRYGAARDLLRSVRTPEEEAALRRIANQSLTVDPKLARRLVRLKLAERLGATEATDLVTQNQYDITVEVSGAEQLKLSASPRDRVRRLDTPKSRHDAHRASLPAKRRSGYEFALQRSLLHICVPRRPLIDPAH